MSTMRVSRPWVVLYSDLRRYLGRALDACSSRPPRVIFFQARAGRPKLGRWFALFSIKATADQLRAARVAFAAGRFQRVCLADLPRINKRSKRHG
jgi:hypothetical protein